MGSEPSRKDYGDALRTGPCRHGAAPVWQLVAGFVDHYNHRRLHSAIGYVTPADKLAGREKAIWQLRDQRLEGAREQRRLRRATAAGTPPPTSPSPSTASV